MAYKPTRIIDGRGRVMIPEHIREALDLVQGNSVDFTLEDDGSIRIRVVEPRCIICGKPVKHKEHAEIDKGSGRKCVCGECTAAICRDILGKAMPQ